ncbi:hypothetical protein CLAIMM_13964 [Cladophialophora immunda]|nr:hypothetical protein CLAIMM_13964 [Cladophialophora immunda]
MHQSVLLPLTFLPPESVQLGRLVLNVQQPHAEFLDPCPVDPQDILIKQADLFHGRESKTNTKSFGSALCHLLSLNRSKERGVTTQVAAARVTTYLLNNSGEWFRHVVRSEDVRKWIEKANRRGDDIYVVTGYHTMLNAHVYESGAHSTSIGGNIALPLAETLTTTGIPVPFPEVVDPSVTAERQQRHTGAQGFLAKGEQVGAIQYRKIQFKWFGRRELHDRPLGDNMWETYLTFRGQTDDIVEVNLEDDLELEDDPGIYICDEDELCMEDTEQDSAEKGGEQ